MKEWRSSPIDNPIWITSILIVGHHGLLLVDDYLSKGNKFIQDITLHHRTKRKKKRNAYDQIHEIYCTMHALLTSLNQRQVYLTHIMKSKKLNKIKNKLASIHWVIREPKTESPWVWHSRPPGARIFSKS